jgi:hypothetical protein
MQCVIIGIIAARPGFIRIRVSRAISFGPNTKPASRISESFVEHRACGLDHGPDPDRGRSIDVAEAIGDSVEVVHGGNLGNQDAVRLRLAGHADVVDPPGRIERVDADQHLALAKTPGGDRLGDLLAGDGLGVGGNGILQIEDNTVGGQRAGLLQRPCIRSRHEQQAAARADHRHSPAGLGLRRCPLFGHRGRNHASALPYHLRRHAESLVPVIGMWLARGHEILSEAVDRRLPDLRDPAVAD